MVLKYNEAKGGDVGGDNSGKHQSTDPMIPMIHIIDYSTYNAFFWTATNHEWNIGKMNGVESSSRT